MTRVLTSHAAPLLAMALLLGLSGCGEPTRVELGGRAIELRLDEFRIEPPHVGARAGRLRIFARAAGSLAHNLRLLSEDESEIHARVPAMKPGVVRAVEATLLPGNYVWICSIGNHRELGMRGTLRVR